MTNEEAYAMDTEFYVEYVVSNRRSFGVFGNNSGFVYASYHEKPDADACCAILNSEVEGD